MIVLDDEDTVEKKLKATADVNSFFEAHYDCQHPTEPGLQRVRNHRVCRQVFVTLFADGAN